MVYFYCGPHPWRRANASVLVGIWQVLYLDRSAEEAYAPLAGLQPCEEFRDASSGASLLPLTVLDVIQVCPLHCNVYENKLNMQFASVQIDNRLTVQAHSRALSRHWRAVTRRA